MADETIEQEYATTDQMMVSVLLMRKFHALRVESLGTTVQYVFRWADVAETVHQILTGQAHTIQVSIADWWEADNTWKMNLRNLARQQRAK